jgi:hypothetical protein
LLCRSIRERNNNNDEIAFNISAIALNISVVAIGIINCEYNRTSVPSHKEENAFYLKVPGLPNEANTM